LATQRGEAIGIRPHSESRPFLSYQDECLSLYKIEWRLALEYKSQRNKFLKFKYIPSFSHSPLFALLLRNKLSSLYKNREYIVVLKNADSRDKASFQSHHPTAMSLVCISLF
jgi:hypothetical protein